MSSEAQCLKSGNMLLKAGGLMTSKKKKWCVMCTKGDKPPWLDFYENQEQSQHAHPKHKKTYHLNQVKSIDKIIKCSSKDFYIDIHFKKGSITLFFDNDNDVEAWNNALQIFVPILGTEGYGLSQFDQEEDDGSTFRPNVLYDSSEDTISFDVKLNETDASRKHHLSVDKPYKLHVTLTNLSLESSEGNILLRWQYEYIRSYGSHKSKGTFNISSGRKAVSGEGDFEFVLQNPTRVTQAIDLQTTRKYHAKQKAKLQAEANAAMPVRSQSLTLSKDPDKEHNDPKRSSQKTVSADFQRQLSEAIDPDRLEKQNRKKSKEKKHDDKKGGFNLFGNKKKDKKDSVKQEIDVKQEIEAEKSSEGEDTSEIPDDHIYDEAVPTTVTKNNIRPPAKTPTPSGKPPVAKRSAPPKSFNEDTDETYDCLAPKGGPRTVITSNKPEESLYGMSSGRQLHIEQEDDYANTYDDTHTFDDEEVEYDDATSAPFRIVQSKPSYPTSAYEEVDIN